MKVELLPLAEHPGDQMARDWVELEDRTPGSFFLSWTWIGSWLASVEDQAALRLMRVSDADETVALGILGQVPRYGFERIGPRTVALNETGKLSEDRITMEHNGLLVRQGLSESVWLAMFDELKQRPGLWQQLRISGVSDAEQLQAIEHAVGSWRLRRRLRGRSPFFWVDLAKVRDCDGGYMSCLSSNTRYQVRRAKRGYSGLGDLRVVEAASLADAMQAFEALILLHDLYWRGRGQPGAFSNAFTQRFHRRLIEAGLASRQIQLLSIFAGDQPIGYLYNFVYRGRVMSYQSGFDYAQDPKLKPGLVCHALAVEHNSVRGAHTYDFLMGDSQYKRSLSTHQDEMVWIDVRRPLLRFVIEDLLRSMKALMARR